MHFQKSNLIHASVLTLLSLWMYYDALNKDFGLLIPFLFGVVLLSLNNGIMYENIQQKNAAFFITILSSIFVFYMMKGFYVHDEIEKVYYFGVMGMTSILSIIVFTLTKGRKTLNRKL